MVLGSFCFRTKKLHHEKGFLLHVNKKSKIFFDIAYSKNKFNYAACLKIPTDIIFYIVVLRNGLSFSVKITLQPWLA